MSICANALGSPDPVVTVHPTFAALGDSDAQCRSAYRTLFSDTLSDNFLKRIRGAVNGGFVLGDARFERQIATMLGRRKWKGSPGRQRKQEPDEEQGELPI